MWIMSIVFEDPNMQRCFGRGGGRSIVHRDLNSAITELFPVLQGHCKEQ